MNDDDNDDDVDVDVDVVDDDDDAGDAGDMWWWWWWWWWCGKSKPFLNSTRYASQLKFNQERTLYWSSPFSQLS